MTDVIAIKKNTKKCKTIVEKIFNKFKSTFNVECVFIPINYIEETNTTIFTIYINNSHLSMKETQHLPYIITFLSLCEKDLLNIKLYTEYEAIGAITYFSYNI